ncbi:MAG TPA: hypothetical protein VIL63_05110 [Terriglobales bacterium]
MALPLRKETPEEELTTADLAQGTRPGREDADPENASRESVDREVLDQENPQERFGPRPVTSDRNLADRSLADRGATRQTSAESGSTALFPSSELEQLRGRWKEVQTGFVDEPRKAVEQADVLVASAMKRLAEVFAEERSKLEKQWDRGDSVSTEDLRVALQRYRTFFDRLLSV